MLRFIYYLLLLVWLVLGERLNAYDAGKKVNPPILDARNDEQVISGEATNGLQPDIILGCSGEGWHVFISLRARDDIPGFTWLAITNHVGSKVELWYTNGVQVLSKNADIVNAFHLPKTTTVSEVMHSGYPRDRRGLQWWRAGNPAGSGTSSAYTQRWILRTAFNMSPTNDYVLKISPLVYKVETNASTAHLVEFPCVTVKLLTNGRVQAMRGTE